MVRLITIGALFVGQACLVERAMAISFEASNYDLEGLPASFVTSDAVKLSEADASLERIGLLGRYVKNGEMRAFLAIADLRERSGRIVEVVLDSGTSAGTGPYREYGVDVDNDGNMELIITGENAQDTRVFARREARHVQVPPPFPLYDRPVMAWIDYNRDGWVDLFLAGDTQSAGGRLESVARLYKNDHGEFSLDRDLLPQFPVSACQAVDLDGDGVKDLAVFPRTGLVNKCPFTTHLYLTRGDSLVETKDALMGRDDLLGASMGRVASGDLDGDGIPELLITGSWHERLGTKAILSVIYHRIAVKGEGFWLDYDARTQDLPDLRGTFVLADLDGDGDMDGFGWGISRRRPFDIVCFENAAGRIADQEVEGWFPDRLRQAVRACTVLPHDFDGDGRLDFLAFSAVSDSPAILLHNTSRATSSPDTRPAKQQ